MVPTSEAGADVREAMDIYNESPKALARNAPDDWYSAKESFNNFLNQPMSEYKDRNGLQFSLPKTSSVVGGIHQDSSPGISPGSF